MASATTTSVRRNILTRISSKAGISHGSTWFLVLFPPSGRGESLCSSLWMAMRKISPMTLAFQFMQVLSLEDMDSCDFEEPTRLILINTYGLIARDSGSDKMSSTAEA